MVGRATGVVQSGHVWQVRDRTCTKEEQRDVSETCCPGLGWTSRATVLTPHLPSVGSTGGGQESVGKLNWHDPGWTGASFSSEVSQGHLNSMTGLQDSGRSGGGTRWAGRHLGTVLNHTLVGSSAICLCCAAITPLLPHQLTNGGCNKWPVTNSTLGSKERPSQDKEGLTYLVDGHPHATQRAGLQNTWHHQLSPPRKEHKSLASPWDPRAAAPPICHF